MNTPLKTKVKYWFDFLRIAHQSQDSEVISNLKKDTYESWGDYLNTPFNEWWKKHSNLFHEPPSIKLKQLNVGDEVQEGVFTIQFPYTYAPTTAAKIFKEMYNREFETRRTDKKKLKKTYRGKFSLSVDDLKVDRLRYYLIYAKKVYLPIKFGDTKSSIRKFHTKAEEVFSTVTKLKGSSKQSTVPFQKDSAHENNIRNVRRYNVYADNIIFNVSLGIFPGTYEKTRIQVKVEKKRPAYKVRKFSKGMPRSMSENYKERENLLDPVSRRKIDKK